MPPVKGLGAFGEAWAAGHLTRLGYRIVERNVRYRCGEIDLIAWDARELVFVEVKCRRSAAFGTPAESITTRKWQRLAAAIDTYLAKHELSPDSYRVDVITIEVGSNGQVSRHELLRAAEPPR